MASFLSDLFGGGAEKEAAQKDIAAAQGYQSQVTPILNQYYNTGTGALNQGIGAYSPLAALGQQYAGAVPMLSNALGLGGAAGTQAAQSAFNAGPGYQWQLKQGLDALARQRAIGGMGASGNADTDAMNYAEGLGNQAYQQWISNLAGMGREGLQATGAAAQGQQAGYTNLANLAQGQGQNLTNVAGNVEQQIVGANNLAAAGEAAGAKNLLGAGLSLATLGLGGNPFGGSLMGGGSGGSGSGGGGGFLSSLGNAFTGLFSGGNWASNNPGVMGSAYYGPVAPKTSLFG